MLTSKLKNAALDWAVANCEGFPVRDGFDDNCPEYSSSWEHGGPIIERELLEIGRQHGEWIACSEVSGDGNWDENVSYGPTPLIAAMRCYVSSKLGDEVEIPKELQ